VAERIQEKEEKPLWTYRANNLGDIRQLLYIAARKDRGQLSLFAGATLYGRKIQLEETIIEK
jgi:hypothetical protein